MRDSHGWLATNKWIPYAEWKKGWQEIKGRMDGESTYYFNPTTHEETYEKPQEMMLEDELREHLAYLEQRKNAEHQVHKVEKLQLQLHSGGHEGRGVELEAKEEL